MDFELLCIFFPTLDLDSNVSPFHSFAVHINGVEKNACQNYQRQINRLDVRSIVSINPTFISKLKLARPFIFCIYSIVNSDETSVEKNVCVCVSD